MKRITYLFAIFGFLVAVGGASHALAAAASEVQPSGRNASPVIAPEQELPWNARVQWDWIPGSRIRESGGDVTMMETKVEFGGQFVVGPRLFFAPGLRYSLRNIDAPDSARLPESLQMLSLKAAGEYDLTDRLSLNFSAFPGLHSDFKQVEGRDFRMPTALYASYDVTEEFTLYGGLAYSVGRHKSPLLPLVGASYEPSEKWSLNVGFPRTAVVFKPDRKTQYYLEGRFNSEEYGIHDASVGARTIRYRDYRVLVGGQWAVSAVAKVGLAAGYAFGRRFAFPNGERGDLTLKSAPLARLEVKIAW